ncbi:hypothetical protein BRARA_I02464 [Brassica rapa]|uniref:BED-type domain-containing protein n=1 Tax=Brassica campestris TaxID=3711 RepID=A0A397XWM0_BRACM|nr:hypothetical protein BRARA_I02464 [Brassica rapa]
MEGEEEPHEQTQSVTQPFQPVRKKGRAKCWEEFTHVGLEADGKERARCNHCGFGSKKTHGISSLNRHSKTCPTKLRSDAPKYDHIADREKMKRDRFLNPDVQHICTQTAAADVYKRYEIEKAKLIEVLVKHKGRVVVMGYICITAHYIDENWRLNNKILAFCSLKPPHNGEVIAKKIYDCLKRWGLEKKVFTITLDNAKANDSMLNILKHQLATSLIENIGESVKFIKESESRKDSFDICVESVGITSGACLSLDVSTKWNSIYEMLARALKFREAFAILNLYERGYKWLPSKEEWKRGVKICDLLKPFNTINTYFSGVNVILAMGAALDPRLKLDILQSSYEKIDPRTSEEKVQVVRDSLISLYEEYQKSANPSKFSATLIPHELLTESPLEDDMDDSNLETYLDVEPRLKMNTFEDIEILSFWKKDQHRYGDLALMASDLLSIPITTIAAESAFSVGGRVLTPFRNRLLPKNVQALIATRYWLKRIYYFDDEEDDDAAAKSNSEVGDSSA